ncbi:DUF3152 domain-containing protein [Streptomyces sp. adm13(2018)]|uniref:DUF3152 domain-containing protein n=1 Tax=Streptomyces sp. adm13(2018) TaxID=2479007 RepID=UPI0021C93F69|nr:DUF3152 domain-containing protein [Streptomyces sp. adm13(2018)]
MLPVLVLVTGSLGAGVALAHFHGPPAEVTAAPAAPPLPVATTESPAPPTTAPAPRPSTARPEPPPPEPRATTPPPRLRTTSPTKPPVSTPPASKADPKKPPAVPQSGPGTFATADASGAPVGEGGELRRYRVQVEEGIALSASDTAAEIQRILAHPRGWAAHGRGRFQLVAEEEADFVIRIATPDTADALCLRQGMDTGGELNCETTDGVVVNLKRWMLGSPTFAGEAAEYRHLIINHEVGHEIGIRQHMGCPGPGRLAPAMMQQIKGLDGCRSNAFPYDEDGSYITGPIVS